MYCVQFKRNDGNPDEEYFYNFLDDAQSHIDLFKNDDSQLYEKIEIIDCNETPEKVVKSLHFRL